MDQEAGRQNSGGFHSNSLIDDIADWLMTQALGSTSADKLLEQCSLRLNAAGIPLWRSNISFQILHPLYQAVSFSWYREQGMLPAEQYAGTENASEDWQGSPYYFIVNNDLPFLRRRLTGPEALLDFSLLPELRDKGSTDYFAYAVSFDQQDLLEIGSEGMVGSWTTDRPSGFSDGDIRSLMRIQQRLGVACKMIIKEQITRNVLGAYLGADAGEKVLQGQIKLGDGESTHSVIWFSDLRNSSGLADSMPPEEFIHLVNDYFQCTAGAVLANQGEVLRFIGDAVLAIFPIRVDGFSEKEACEKALDAGKDAIDKMINLNKIRKADGEEPLGFGLGLHVGDVMYGNIGIPERVEFSVVGPAANEVARLETLTKSLGHQILMSDHFARALELAPGDRELVNLGKHELRGVGEPMEVFALPTGNQS